MPPGKYKLAELCHYDYDLSKRWYVSFWAYDVAKGQNVRKRLFDPINRKKTVLERLDVAREMIASINNDLQAGKVLGKDKVRDLKTNVIKFTLLQGIDYVYDQKIINNHRVNYVKNFSRLKGKIQLWLESEGREDFPLRNFDQDDAFSFFDFLQEQKVSNKTFNNYRNDFATAFNFLMKRNPNLFEQNPIGCIDPLPVLVRKHAAYSDAQMKAIQDQCKKMHYEHLLLHIQFIYYTLARPTELKGLKVGDIDLEESRILFRAEISKNRRDEYVGIPVPLRKVIIDRGIMNYPKHFFVFGIGKPAERAASRLYFYNRCRKVIEALGYDKLNVEHSLYSFKHSGAISLYKATKDIKLLQRQCRHTGLDQTNTYLRDLSLLTDYDGLKNWAGAI